ncbi:hypothetical protein Scep_023596 [Stephania cephalantha]|uniref:Uncharacterized protein n=1 Tax=Stephania cephalantha TaxID=152367 RepID=A0AAP0EW02_9MAGN
MSRLPSTVVHASCLHRIGRAVEPADVASSDWLRSVVMTLLYGVRATRGSKVVEKIARLCKILGDDVDAHPEEIEEQLCEENVGHAVRL